MVETDKIFFDYISNLIASETSLQYEWKNNNSIIEFKKFEPTGFNITLTNEHHGFIVFTDYGLHIHFDVYNNYEETLSEAMGLVRDLLSSNMRIVEKLRNGKPYKWILQSQNNGVWIDETEMGLLFYNYFSKVSENIYSNSILPQRNNMYE